MTYRVLILCTGNSARSQMAEAIINARRGEQWQAFSAGTQPVQQVNPYALRALTEIGIQTEGSTPKYISEFSSQSFDLIVTVCDDAAENCPIWPGQGKRLHIGFPDPAKASGSDEDILRAFRQVRDDISKRILEAIDEFSRS